jgi:hypothetical protein
MKSSAKAELARLVRRQRTTERTAKRGALASELLLTEVTGLKARLDAVLEEQRRTNRLLELALRAAFDDEEQRRT